jgi:hypothetical protein
VAFSANRTQFVGELVKAQKSSGTTAKEIAAVFSSRRISRSDNLIYNALNALVKQKKLQHKGDRYFWAGDKARASQEPVIAGKKVAGKKKASKSVA